MSESSGLALPLIVHWPYRLKTVIQRIIRGRRLPMTVSGLPTYPVILPFALMSRRQRRGCGYGSHYAEAGTAVNMFILV